MVIFHSYVKLPEGIYIYMKIPCDRILISMTTCMIYILYRNMYETMYLYIHTRTYIYTLYRVDLFFGDKPLSLLANWNRWWFDATFIEHSYRKCYGNGPFIDYKKQSFTY